MLAMIKIASITNKAESKSYQKSPSAESFCPSLEAWAVASLDQRPALLSTSAGFPVSNLFFLVL